METVLPGELAQTCAGAVGVTSGGVQEQVLSKIEVVPGPFGLFAVVRSGLPSPLKSPAA
jgi:hypothetical protein